MAGSPASPQDAIAQNLMRAVAAQRARVGSDLNQAPAFPEFDPVTKTYFYETAPAPLRQQFGSPLAEKGGLAQGPGNERLVTSGWGDPLPFAATPPGSVATYNQALEYAATLGESVFAAADGVVRFVGVQLTQGSAEVADVHANEQAQTVLDFQDTVVASAAMGNIGYGGIYVVIQHNGDFQGYQTEYYRLSQVSVKNGQVIGAGQAIGTVGGAGGATGWTKPGFSTQAATGIVMRFQAALISGALRALVNPTSLVPNYWPGHPDSTIAGSSAAVAVPPLAPVGSQMATARAANLSLTVDRATTLENNNVAAVKALQSAHANFVALTIAVETSALTAATTGFTGASPQVQTPMTFDFTTGLWSDGKPT